MTSLTPTLLAQAIFVFVFAVTLVDLAHRRDLPRLEIAALFASVGVLSLVQVVATLTGRSLPLASALATPLFLAQPYLLLRLLAHFRPVRRLQHGLALALLLASWLILFLDQPPLEPAAALAVILAFACVEGYAAVAFIRSAIAARGVARRRLTMVAAGSALLGALIVLAGLSLLIPAVAPFGRALIPLAALATAGTYYVGFAPPAWLRRAWQLAEFRRYVASLAGQSPEERLGRAVDTLAPAAARAVGGTAAVTFLWDPIAQRLRPHKDEENSGALSGPAGAEIALGEGSPLLATAWRERRPISAGSPRAWGESLRTLAAAFGGAGSALIVPLIAGNRSHGLVVVFLQRGPLFLEDDLAVLGLLAAEAAVAVTQAELVSRLRQQNASLAEASRLKSAFLATMSHELRTPLNAIIGFSELLLDEPANGYDRSTHATYLQTIHDSGQHLLALINDVLDLSKIEAGKMELRPEPFRVADVVSTVVSTVEPLAKRKRLSLATHLDGAGTIVADEGKVKQILYNLLSNAIKFTPEGGHIDVFARRGLGAIQLTVADTGIGIAPADQERVFQEFQQLDSGLARRHEGTGLGLALTRRLVELHGGRLWVESGDGTPGSRFHFTLPFNAVPNVSADPAIPTPDDLASPPTPAPAASGVATEAPLILAVEDDPSAASILSLYLGRGGFRVHVVPDGVRALEAARRLHPAAVTLDVLLPKLDGWDVLAALKLDPATRDIPVVVVTIVDDEQRAYALGAVDYFVKPVERAALLDSLRRHLPPPHSTTPPVTDGHRTPSLSRAPRVLAIDDDPTALDLYNAVLTPVGYDFVRALGGADGLAVARRRRPDVVILDLMMPDVSGFDVLAALRADPLLRHVPVLVVTAKDLTDEDKALLNGRVAAIFEKHDGAGVDLLAWLASLPWPDASPVAGEG